MLDKADTNDHDYDYGDEENYFLSTLLHDGILFHDGATFDSVQSWLIPNRKGL